MARKRSAGKKLFYASKKGKRYLAKKPQKKIYKRFVGKRRTKLKGKKVFVKYGNHGSSSKIIIIKKKQKKAIKVLANQTQNAESCTSITGTQGIQNVSAEYSNAYQLNNTSLFEFLSTHYNQYMNVAATQTAQVIPPDNLMCCVTKASYKQTFVNRGNVDIFMDIYDYTAKHDGIVTAAKSSPQWMWDVDLIDAGIQGFATASDDLVDATAAHRVAYKPTDSYCHRLKRAWKLEGHTHVLLAPAKNHVHYFQNKNPRIMRYADIRLFQEELHDANVVYHWKGLTHCQIILLRGTALGKTGDASVTTWAAPVVGIINEESYSFKWGSTADKVKRVYQQSTVLTTNAALVVAEEAHAVVAQDDVMNT